MGYKMEYEEKFEIAKKSLIDSLKKQLNDNWNKMFNMYLSCEADHEFGYIYQHVFKEQFEKYMNDDVKSRLFLAGRNIVFAICAFMEFKHDAELEDVLKFTEMFVINQLDDFDNWCDEFSMGMYEESSEYERECEDERKREAQRNIKPNT